jgi:DnaJ-class molecular chaperone
MRYARTVTSEPCRVCGGDGRIANAFGGGEKRCPGCSGTGRRSDDTGIFRDVTKTKPSHHRPSQKAEPAAKQTWPATHEGDLLAKEVQASSVCTDATKARLIREIIEYEGTHGTCTQTFSRKVRKQIRPPSPGR